MLEETLAQYESSRTATGEADGAGWITTVWSVSYPLSLILEMVIAGSLFRAARTDVARSARFFLRAGAVLLAVLTVLAAFRWLFRLVFPELGHEAVGLSRVTEVLFGPLGAALLFLIVDSTRRIRRASGARGISLLHILGYAAVVLSLVSVGIDLTASELRLIEMETMFRTDSAIRITCDIALAAVLYPAARALARPAPAAPSSESQEEGTEAGWESAAAGLDVYAGALGIRVVAGIAVGLLMVMANFTRSAELAKVLLLIAPVVSVLLTLPMIGGVLRFSTVPAEDARGLAVIAAICMVCALGVDLWVLSLAAAFQSGSLADMFDAQDLLPIAEALGYVFGAGAIFSLLGAFHRVAQTREDTDLQSRITRVATLVGSALALALITRILLAADADFGGVIVALGLSLAFLVLAISALVDYLGVLSDLRATMRRTSPAAGAIES